MAASSAQSTVLNFNSSGTTTTTIRCSYSSTVIQMQHGVISLSIHRMTANVNESTKTLNGNNSLCLSWNAILMNGLHLNLLVHNTNPHTICNSIIFMKLSFHFGNHAHMLIMHASLSL